MRSQRRFQCLVAAPDLLYCFFNFAVNFLKSKEVRKGKKGKVHNLYLSLTILQLPLDSFLPLFYFKFLVLYEKAGINSCLLLS